MDEKKNQSLNEVVASQSRDAGGRVSLNEVMDKRYRLYRNHNELVKDSYDIGSLKSWIHERNSDGSVYQIVDAQTGQVIPL